MRVLVTGANGHIGANLVRVLLSRGDKVRALIHRGAAAVDGLEIEMVRGDVRDPGSIAAAMDGVDSVFHLAAFISIDGPHNGLVHQINVDGSRNVAEAALAAGVRRLVHFSSIHAFKQTPGDQPLDEERAKVSGRGHPAYDLSNAAGEAEVRTLIAKGLDAVIVNLSGVIGPFDFGPSRMGRVFLQLYERRIAGLVSGGFNWVDVRDVVAGALAAAERGRTGENYLLSGRWLTIRELASIAAEITGIAPPSLSSPMWLARSVAPLALLYSPAMRRPPLFTPESPAALAANRDLRSDKARRELDHVPRPTRETGAGDLSVVRRGWQAQTE